MKMSDPKIKDATLVELSALSRDLRQEKFNLLLQQASCFSWKTGPAPRLAPRHRPRRNPDLATAQAGGIKNRIYLYG